MASLLTLGSSALNAANVGLRTTGHNIANVNTPGYSRQVAVATTPMPQFSGSGFFGRGVEISTVRRVYDGFLTAQAHTATARAGEAFARAGQLDLVNGILGTTDGGIGAAMNAFQGAIGAAASHPGDLASRQSALSSAQALASQFNDAASRLAEQRRGVEAQLRSLVGGVNQQLKDVADLNRQIQLAQGNGQPPNDLLDRRDTLVRNLSQSIGVTSVSQSDGSLSLFVGSGQSVVLGASASTLSLQPDAFDPRHPVLGITQGSTFPPSTRASSPAAPSGACSSSPTRTSRRSRTRSAASRSPPPAPTTRAIAWAWTRRAGRERTFSRSPRRSRPRAATTPAPARSRRAWPTPRPSPRAAIASISTARITR
ncbi:MAG: flagellar hook-associated protein FlgK [Betaproteobacteria bacterium]|nr:flagellar hook-associated protein FlgK [Betaproteobacteria bacterium]